MRKISVATEPELDDGKPRKPITQLTRRELKARVSECLPLLPLVGAAAFVKAFKLVRSLPKATRKKKKSNG